MPPDKLTELEIPGNFPHLRLTQNGGKPEQGERSCSAITLDG